MDSSPTLYIALAWAVTGRRFARSGRSVSATARSHPSSCMRRRTACLSASLVGVVSARSAPATCTCQFTSRIRLPSWPGSSSAIWSASSRGIPLGATRPSTTAPSRSRSSVMRRQLPPAARAHPPGIFRSSRRLGLGLLGGACALGVGAEPVVQRDQHGSQLLALVLVERREQRVLGLLLRA